MTAVLCIRCDRPVPDALPLCQICGDSVVEDLLSVPSLIAELQITRARLDRITANRAGGRSAEIALPVRLFGRRGAEMLGDRPYRQLENAVGTWARALAEHLGADIPIGAPGLVQVTANNRRRDRDGRAARIGAEVITEPVTPIEQAAVWLACHPHELRTYEAAAELVTEIRWAVDNLRLVVDRPIERRYLGPCPGKLTDGTKCGFELRADKDASWVRCRRCGNQHDIRRIEGDARDAAENKLYTVADLVRLLGTLGSPVPRATVYLWAKERRIEPRGWQHRDQHGTRITDHRVADSDSQVYRLGDALKLAARETSKGGSAA